MHNYLRSIGFTLYKKEKDIDNLLEEFRRRYMDAAEAYLTDYGEVRFEIRACVAGNMGICIVGTVGDDGVFRREYYYPYIWTDDLSTTVQAAIQRHVDDECYSGLCDDTRVGITLIFRVDNPIPYIEMTRKGKVGHTKAFLGALSTEGKVLLPVEKTAKQVEMAKIAGKKRDALIEAARGGDQSAMETLSRDDMNLFSVVSRRMQREDIYSIVDTCFLPQGVECDVYSVVADILAVNEVRNQITAEVVYDLTLCCNDIVFHCGINKADLLGEPKKGRRFKGKIWMQGRVFYDDIRDM